MLSSDVFTPTMMPMSPPKPFPELSKATEPALPSNTPIKKLRSTPWSTILKRSSIGAFDAPSRMAKMAGPFTNVNCWVSILSLVPFLMAASRPPENEQRIVRTTIILIISRILCNLSQCFGPDFIQQWIQQIDYQNSENCSINIGADITYQNSHDTAKSPINEHGNEIDG